MEKKEGPMDKGNKGKKEEGQRTSRRRRQLTDLHHHPSENTRLQEGKEMD